MFLILGLLLFIMMNVGVCSGTVSQMYLVVKVNESVRINCTPDAGASNVQWYFGSGPQSIDGGNQPYLDINDVQLQNAGLYQCTWTISNGNQSESASAILVVLEQDPVFSSNISQDGVVDGDVVKLTCSVSFRDYLIYSISILDRFGGTPVNYSYGTLVTDSIIHNISAEYLVPANSQNPHENFTCLIEFFDVVEESFDKGTLFYNRTLYTSLNVTYPVRKVGPNTKTVAVNGTIECQSDAFPPAFKYEWKYLGSAQYSMDKDRGNSTDIVFITTEHSLTLFTPGEFYFSCTAFNLVKSINYSSSWTGVIQVSVSSENGEKDGANTRNSAILAGIIGGSIGGFLLIVIIVILIACKRRRRPAESPTGSLHQQIISPPKSPLSDDDLTVVDNDLYSAFCDQKAKLNGTSSAQKPPGNDYMSRNRTDFDTTIVDNMIYDSSPPPCTATNASNLEDGQDGGYASVEEMKGFHSTLQSKGSLC